MKTNALLKLYQKQVDICDMIIKAENNRVNFERDGYTFRKRSDSRWYGDYGQHLDQMVKRYADIKERLILYHNDVLERIKKLAPVTLTDAHSHLYTNTIS